MVRATESNRPASYLAALRRAQSFAHKQGVSWDAGEGAATHPRWSLQQLVGGDTRRSPKPLVTLSVDIAFQNCAVNAGIPRGKFPAGALLSESSREFIKTFAALQCKMKLNPTNINNQCRALKRILSITRMEPWNLSSSDMSTAIRAGLSQEMASKVAFAINKNLLSAKCPLSVERPTSPDEAIFDNLEQRKSGDRLPDMDVFSEVLRIAFQETAATHNELIKFGVLRAMAVTGLRAEEAIRLPSNPLIWSCGVRPHDLDAFDGWLKVRYFAGKQGRGKSDILVEKTELIPKQFVKVFAETIEELDARTLPLRRLLKTQSESPYKFRSDIRTMKTSAGKDFYTYEFLFLVLQGTTKMLPEDAGADARIGPAGMSVIFQALGANDASGKKTSIFAKYGSSDKAKRFRLKSHSFRHMLDTELLASGLSDLIVSHHHNRQSVPQTLEHYDHRTFGEVLESIEMPEIAKPLAEKNSVEEVVVKLLTAGFLDGSPLHQTFLKIQREAGDEAAFEYVVAHSDGFHVTPYGLCFTNFSLSPCQLHLRCLQDCSCYAPSGLPEHNISLESLRSKISAGRDKAAKGKSGIGRKNQIEHADKLIRGIDKALNGAPGIPVFPDGFDYSSLPESSE